jgi:molybdate transport system substrate-binding protein
MVRFAFAFLFAALDGGSVASVARSETPPVRIAAASDLRFALAEILTAFHAARPDLRGEASYGSSGNFFAQVREGAPFDVFLSADTEYTRRLFAEGVSEAPFPYAVGRLALVVRKDSGLDPKGFGDLLTSPAIRRVGIANPAHAPYGRAAEATLRSWKVNDLVATKLVYGDSVSQAAQFMDTGAVQAALIALSLTRATSPDFVFAEVPQAAHPPLDQAGVVLKKATALEGARSFQALLTGEAGRAILARYGFGLPTRR